MFKARWHSRRALAIALGVIGLSLILATVTFKVSGHRTNRTATIAVDVKAGRQTGTDTSTEPDSEAAPTGITLSSITAKSGTGGVARWLCVGLAGLVLAAGSLFVITWYLPSRGIVLSAVLRPDREGAPPVVEKIMVVDSDLNLQWALKYRLEKEGYDVLLAGDGADALEKVKAEKPDLIILDLALPRMDGFEFLEQMKGDVGASAVPVIVLTAYAYEPIRARSLELGAVDFVAKPFSPRELVAEVWKILGAKECQDAGPMRLPSESSPNSLSRG